MNYIVPVLLNIKDKSLESEVDFIKKYEFMKGNSLRIITPFYYPICTESLNYSYSFLIDPYSMKIHKLIYRIPDTILLIKFFKTISYKQPLIFLRELYSIVKKYNRINEWIEHGVVFDRVIFDNKLRNSIVNLLEYIRIDNIKGIVFEPVDVESIIGSNKLSFEKIFSDLNKAIINIDFLKNLLIRYRNKCCNNLSIIYEERSKTWNRIYSVIDRVIDSNIREINDFYENEKSSIVGKYSVRINKLNRILKALDESINYNTRRIKSTQGDLRSKYREVLSILKKRRKALFRDMVMIEKQFRDDVKNIEKKYLLFKNIENSRRRFFLSEKSVFNKEYIYSMNLLNLYIDRIVSILDNIVKKIEEYRENILNQLLVVNPIVTNQCIYIRGYIVSGLRGIKIYTPGFVVKRFDYRIVFNELYRKMLIDNNIVYKLMKMNPSLLDEYNLLKQ